MLAIWAYESVADYFTKAKTTQESSTSSFKGPSATPVRLGKQIRNPSWQGPPAVGSRSQNSFEWGPESAVGSGAEQPTPTEDLRSLVLNLMAKVDNLTAQVAEQQNPNGSVDEVEVTD